MKKFLYLPILFVVLTIAQSFLSYTLAQTQEEVEQEREVEVNDVEGLRAELKQYTQNPNSKDVKFEMILYPTVSSDRVKVTWELSGLSLFPEKMKTYITEVSKDGSKIKTQITYQAAQDALKKNYLVYGTNSEFKIESGKTYYIDVTVRPGGYGLTELSGRVEAVRVDGNLLVTVDKLFGSNSQGEVLPITDDYKKAKTLDLVKKVAMIFGGVVLALVLGYFGFKRFVKWLDKDDVEGYETRRGDVSR